jgi:uncharacterized membrane protein YidH (DUF202 family)
LKTLRKSEIDDPLFTEIQLILAEKRTALAGLRTGIAVFALPLSVISMLVATSKLYNPFQVLHLLIVLMVLNVGLICLGIYLVMHSLARIHHLDGLIREIKRKHSSIAEFLN